jgi:acetolactate synthase-1/2/3 large subunit
MTSVGEILPRLLVARGEGRLHEVRSQGRLMAELCTFSRNVLAPEMLPEALDEAMALFAARRPRPVHIEIPIDVLKLPADGLDRAPSAVPAAEPARRRESEARVRDARRRNPALADARYVRHRALAETVWRAALEASLRRAIARPTPTLIELHEQRFRF